MKQFKASDIVKKVANVASLPQIYLKVDEAINNPFSSSEMLAEIISQDPGLAVKLLKLANSSFYNFRGKVESISKAITVIGTQQLRDLVLANSVLKLFKNVPEELLNMEDFWRHSIACGLHARIIANVRRESNVERFFVAGLLHTIGRLILLSELPNEMPMIMQAARDKKKLLFEVEELVLGFSHATVGGLLLKSWKLSDRMVEQTYYHHRPEAATRHHADVAVIHIADIMATALELGSSGEVYVPPLSEQAWRQLKINSKDTRSILQEAHDGYEDAVTFILGD